MSLSKAKEKAIKRLHIKKFRNVERLFIAEGNKLVADLISAGLKPVELFVHTDFDAQLFPEASLIDVAERKRISTLDNPAGVLAVFEMPTSKRIDEVQSSSLALYGIQDPGNMGTIIRTAAWFGLSQIILLEGCVDPFNPKVVQASMGSLAHIDVVVSTQEELETLISQQFTVFLADMDGEDVYSVDWPEKWLLIMGNEGQGLRDLSINGTTLSIPRFNGNGPESLNVAIASAVILTVQAKKMRL